MENCPEGKCLKPKLILQIIFVNRELKAILHNHLHINESEKTTSVTLFF